jgi:hypothetical protein
MLEFTCPECDAKVRKGPKDPLGCPCCGYKTESWIKSSDQFVYPQTPKYVEPYPSYPYPTYPYPWDDTTVVPDITWIYSGSTSNKFMVTESN